MTERREQWSTFLAGVVFGAACLHFLYYVNSGPEKSSADEEETAAATKCPSKQSLTASNATGTGSIDKKDRSLVASHNNSTSGRPTLEDLLRRNDNKLEIEAIGVVRSVYRLCVGTPRQGLLVPHARGRLDLTRVPSETVQGLEEYSHIWILFIFHLNTLPKQGMGGNKKSPMKIAPPILGGRKIGVLASRSPHRPNPVGVTLARLDRIQASNDNKLTSLYLSGVDLVDGTPVVDIKPFVPLYDSDDTSKVPDWVMGGLALRRSVSFSAIAEEQLSSILYNKETRETLAFYGRDDESTEQALVNIRACIEEVLSIDVRSQWQTSKARSGKSQAERADRLKQLETCDVGQVGLSDSEHTSGDGCCTQQLDNLLIRFQVQQAKSEGLEQQSSSNSGAEDFVLVTSIQLFGNT
ncbi:hypothetical protein ACA910_005806 [Epithemia clementina (nom. ined.)]